MLSEQVRLAGGSGVVVPTPQELLGIGLAHPPNFAPGAEYEYSNTNYVILGLIVEQLEKKPLATVFEERLFTPLGMTNTMFPPAASNAIPEPFSHGYLYGGAATMMVGSPPYTPAMEAAAKAGTLRPKDYTDVNHSFAFAAGAVISTAADLATWMAALAGGKVFNAEYQKIWQDSAKSSTPRTRTTGTGTASTSCDGDRTSSTCTAVRHRATTLKRPTTRTTT